MLFWLFLGLEGILVIFWVSGAFGIFLSFEGFLGFGGYFCHF